MATAALRGAFAAVALAAATAAAAADDLGTLFTTHEERARLDHMRRGEPAPSAATSAARTHSAQVTGFVKRSDGRHTVWIDGLAVPVGTPGAERLLDTGTVREYSDRGDDVRIERKNPR